MKFLRLQFAAAAAAVILLGLFGRDAQPQPARTIKIVVRSRREAAPIF
jgi:hypothetical protein